MGKASKRRGRQRRQAAASSTAADEAMRSWRPGRLIYAVCGVVIAAGLVLGMWMFGLPVLRSVRADGWTEARCTIVESRVDAAHKGPDKLVVEYRLEAGGRSVRGEGYSFWHRVGLLSDAWRKHEALRVGQEVPCWHDPDDPGDVVLDRGFDGRGVFGLGLALVLIVPGAWVMWRTRGLRSS